MRIKILDKYEVAPIDKLNIGISEYREVEKKGGKKSMEWVRKSLFFQDYKTPLILIFNRECSNYGDDELMDLKEAIKKMDEIQHAICYAVDRVLLDE